MPARQAIHDLSTMERCKADLPLVLANGYAIYRGGLPM